MNQTHTKIDLQTDGQVHEQTDRADRLDRQTDRQDRQTNRQTEGEPKQTERQT